MHFISNIGQISKRVRCYERLKAIAPGDELIEVSAPAHRSAWAAHPEDSEALRLRRMTFKTDRGKDYVLYANVVGESISKEEIQALYATRWDIEIGIREIKTVMDIHVLRAKTPEMALKELTVSLTAYHLIGKIIWASIQDLPFSPKEDFIYRFYTHHKRVLMDKKGSIYQRGQRVVDELHQLIWKEMLPKRKPGRHYPRRTKQGRYRKYK